MNVQRLRDMAGLQRKMDMLAGSPGQTTAESSKLLEAAADEIEHLRALMAPVAGRTVTHT